MEKWCLAGAFKGGRVLIRIQGKEGVLYRKHNGSECSGQARVETFGVGCNKPSKFSTWGVTQEDFSASSKQMTLEWRKIRGSSK